MDWTQAGVTVGMVLAGVVGKDLLRHARDGVRIQTLFEKQREHGDRLDSHERQIREIPDKFVPRTELGAITDGVKRTNWLLDRMLLRRAGLPDDEDR